MRRVFGLVDVVGRGLRLQLTWRALRPIVAAAILVAVAAPSVRAADAAGDADQETALREKANALMASSNWADALPIWAQLYGSAGKPLDLWNAAVCQYHRAQAGQATPDQALALLRQYHDAPGVPDEKRAKAQRYIDDMTALNERKPATSPPPAASPKPDAVVVVASPQTPPAPPTEASSPLRTAAWITGGVGAAALLTGVYFTVRTHSLDSSVTTAPKFNVGDDNSGRQAETLQFVMYGIGAAAVATAGVLYYLASSRHETSSVAFLPAAGPSQAGAVVTVRF
jgi:hypothetical protein